MPFEANRLVKLRFQPAIVLLLLNACDLAASAVKATDHPDSRWKFYPYATDNGTGILAEYKF